MQLRRSTRLRTVHTVKNNTSINGDHSLISVSDQVSEKPEDRFDKVDQDSDDDENGERVAVQDISFDEDERMQSRTGQTSATTLLKISRPEYNPQDLKETIHVDTHFVNQFNDLIEKQSTLFFNSLTSPEYVIYNNLEIFKYPSDKVSLQTISRQLTELLPDLNKNYDTDLKELLKQLHEDQEREENLKILNQGPEAEVFKDPLQSLLNYQPDVKESDESKLIEQVAKIHEINISDISDILINPPVRTLKRALNVNNQTKKHDISHISNKCSRLLTKERNHSLPWPVKKKKKQTDSSAIHEDVSLMS